jgi:hypothetical protein
VWQPEAGGGRVLFDEEVPTGRPCRCRGWSAIAGRGTPTDGRAGVRTGWRLWGFGGGRFWMGGCRPVQVQGLSTVAGLVGGAGWEDTDGRPYRCRDWSAVAVWGDVDGRPCRCRDYRRLLGWWATLDGGFERWGRCQAGVTRQHRGERGGHQVFWRKPGR